MFIFEFKQFLNEMPISQFNLRGDWSPEAKRLYGFNATDAGILNSEKGIEKIHRQWSNSKQNYDMYFVREKGAYKHFDKKEVTADWVEQNLGFRIQPREDTITIIFTNNIADEKIPMTAWTIAHRFGHAIRNTEHFKTYFSDLVKKDFAELLAQMYAFEVNYTSRYSDDYSQKSNLNDKYLKALAYAVGSMRSARQRNLRNFDEFTFELLAQYILTGHIKFNPLPKSLLVQKRFAWGQPNHQIKNSILPDDQIKEWDYILEGHAGTYEYYLDQILGDLEGRIFVM